MDTTLLHQFRQQLATWIETRLSSQRLPFQRLELCPATLTDRGMLTPDLVLWINRDSQLAGSIILLPDIVEDRVLAEGVSLCKALGLGHFTIWAAREVSIWLVVSSQSSLLHSFPLPPANKVTPEDFQRSLDNLLGRLKVITVTSAPSTADYTVHYFVNLCLRNLQELTPGLTISARMSAGETAADKWVEHAPREKAWMSLWRILFLLWKGRLPPGLQPERLELAIHYALTDLTTGQLSWFDLQDSEPPLPEEDAVRLHHLASRLRQLGWPRNDESAEELVCLLLNESAHRFELKTPLLPWDTGELEFWVNCQPPMSLVNCALIAPRAYLAGWAFRTILGRRFGDSAYAEDLQALDMDQHFTSGIAILHETQPLNRKERSDRLIFLRQVWPSRRFDLPGNAPAWLWDALYLAGLISEELSLILPHGWHRAPGILNLWAILAERYHLTDIAESASGIQALRFVPAVRGVTSVRIHRSNLSIDIPANLLAMHKPGTTQVWLKATQQTIELIRNQEMTGIANHCTDEPKAQSWGLFLFLQTRLGKYLWGLCSDQSALPDFNMASDAVANFGVPVPNENILSDLSVIGSPDTLAIPEQDVLEREFTSIFGSVPTLPEGSVHVITDAPKARRRSSVPTEEIAVKVFQDGVPRFPEHYLMHIYRPALIHYDLCGPLEIAEEFFGRISLRTPGQDHIIEVSGKIVAEALLLASYGGEAKVSLPEDESILEDLVLHYRSDLKRLWDNLVSECRRVEPHRQAAVRLARRIWQQYGLPPENAP
ncbi:MAG: hypothetical protein IH613_00385 [Desulfuromonadales bacterium]|nr:hypothetical protein [Desulfuromonadales bacterium]